MSEASTESLPRETGAEKAPESCPVCGGPLQVTTSAYGSTSSDCPACREKNLSAQTASASSEARETGTNVTTPVVTTTASSAAPSTDEEPPA